MTYTYKEKIRITPFVAFEASGSGISDPDLANANEDW